MKKKSSLLFHGPFFLWQIMSRIWQRMTPWMVTKGSCRFTPTCSQFARQAVDQYGMILGVWMSLRRLRKCHPFHQGGYDPVDKYR